MVRRKGTLTTLQLKKFLALKYLSPKGIKVVTKELEKRRQK